MTYVFLAIKRAARTVYYPILLILLLLALVFAPLLGETESVPIAAVCDLDSSAASERVVEYLTDGGFVVCSDTEKLYSGIAAGEYDCGAIIPEDFEQRLSDNNSDGVVTFVTSPTSFAPDLHKNRIAAAIYTELAPLTAHALLPESDITVDETVQKYRQLLEDGAVFTFEIIRGTDTEPSASVTKEGSRAQTYTLGAASFLIFALMMYSACEITAHDIKPLSPRIGIKPTLVRLILPDIFVRVLGVLTAAMISGLISFAVRGDTTVFSLYSALAVYTLLAAASAILAVTVLSDAGRVQIYTFFVLIIALTVCPIYTDIALFLPWMRGLRWLITPYLLWLCADHTLLCAPIALAALPSALWAMYIKHSARQHSAD